MKNIIKMQTTGKVKGNVLKRLSKKYLEKYGKIKSNKPKVKDGFMIFKGL